jgi:hypothetical protein
LAFRSLVRLCGLELEPEGIEGLEVGLGQVGGLDGIVEEAGCQGVVHAKAFVNKLEAVELGVLVAAMGFPAEFVVEPDLGLVSALGIKGGKVVAIGGDAPVAVEVGADRVPQAYRPSRYITDRLTTGR